MAVVTKEINEAKEIGEIMDLIVAIVETVVNEGEYTELVDDLLKAIDGIGDIGEESKNKEAMYNAVALRLVKVAGIFA